MANVSPQSPAASSMKGSSPRTQASVSSPSAASEKLSPAAVQSIDAEGAARLDGLADAVKQAMSQTVKLGDCEHTDPARVSLASSASPTLGATQTDRLSLSSSDGPKAHEKTAEKAAPKGGRSPKAAPRAKAKGKAKTSAKKVKAAASSSPTSTLNFYFRKQ